VTRRRQVVSVLVVAIAAAAAGYGTRLWHESGSDRSAGALMAVRLADVEGRQQPLDQWRGKVLVVNFWATWCEPCREEIPAFVKLQEKYRARGLQFVGIAIDQRDKIQIFAQQFGINYPVLLGGIDAVEISRQSGNRVGALPFTVVLDRHGRIVGRELGKASEARLEGLFHSLL
jgi:thiol-disulfide isomerase/thioredoxin